jgi:hypothetical protein
MVPYTSLWYVSVIVMCHFSLMNPLIILYFSQYRQFAGNHYRLISNVCVPFFFFLILYPSSDTTPKNASPFACLCHAWIHYMGVSSLIRNSIIACYQITCPLQLLSCTEIWPNKGDVIFILVWEDRWN